MLLYRKAGRQKINFILKKLLQRGDMIFNLYPNDEDQL
jgi:hypothetical protein